MPTITINKRDLLNLIGKKLTEEELKDRISMLGTDLGEVSSNEITVEIFPNRPDLLSVEGLARALATFTSHKRGLKNYKIKKAGYKSIVDKKVSSVRPFVAHAVVKNVKLDDNTIKSLMQIQEKLHLTHGRNRKKASIGVYDLDKIKFPLTYTTKPKTFKFVPLDEIKEMTLHDILVNHPKGKEFGHLILDHSEYPILHDSTGLVLSMPPVINSERTKVTNKTKNLFIDVTGLDEKTVETALNIIVTNLADRNSEIYEVKVDNKTYPNLTPKEMKLNLSYVNKRLGLNLDLKQAKSLLEKMGLDLVNNNVLIPAYRADIISQADLVEDIAIAHGYENFNLTIPNVSTIAKEDKFEHFKNKVAHILTNSSLIETNTYNLSNELVQNKNVLLNNKLTKVLNAVNMEYDVFRYNVLPSLLEVFSSNKLNEYPQKIFEIGTVLRESEEQSLAIALTNSKITYTEIKQVLDVLFLELNLSYKLKEFNHGSFIQGRCARILVNNKEIGFIGEIHPQVLTNFNLNYPVAALELNLTELFKHNL